jgi:hypothetical protein
MIYFIVLNKSVPSPLFLSICFTPSLFLNETMKNQVLNKIVCSVLKNFNATLIFSVFNKYEEGKVF